MNPAPSMKRDRHGVFHVRGHAAAAGPCSADAPLCYGLGRCHATDRGMQMLLMRLLGQGRISELLDSTDESLAIDTFFRRMNWTAGLSQASATLTPRARELCDAYVSGVNAVLSRRRPWEFRLFGYRPEPWTLADTLLMARITGYVTLAQSQAEIERLLVELLQAGIRRELLEELFPGLLGELDEDLIRQVTLGERIVPPQVKWTLGLPRMMASNNWVVAGSKTASGKPLLANDPHLETNRLPNVWYEIVLERGGGGYVIGATLPGVPAVMIGRTRDVAWGVTYAFADAIDSWIERCREGCCFREPDQWIPLQRRTETISRRGGKPPVRLTFYENEHGVLDGDPFVQGYHLATRWSAAQSGPASLDALLGMWHAGDVAEGMEHLGRVETAWNWVLADRQGNIGYQMSGLMPVRRAGVRGLVPLPGWKRENDWQGFVDSHELPRAFNPRSGFIVTANHDLNSLGSGRPPINMPMGPWRARRIESILAGGESFTAQDMQRLQYDVRSLHAQRFMEIIRPLLPVDVEQSQILREWDCRYDIGSRGAFLFEQVYRGLLLEVFGGGLGADVARHLADETAIFWDFYDNFDRILLAESSAWFGGESRDAVYRRVVDRALRTAPRPWGECLQLPLTNILFQGKLPRWLGFDRGPVAIPGGRATVHQGQIYRSSGRTTSFIPSYRMVTDLAEDTVRSNLCGGPSDRRFSRWYCSEVANWLAGVYKQLAPC